jgi:RNA polymerase-binding transcription factor DksA
MASALTKAQLDELRRKLERERERIRAVLAAPPGDAPQRDQESEIEEAAQRETERTQGDEVEARERALLGEVERALAKLDRGTYGVGEQTGDRIPYERLAAVPWAREPVDE